jgi:glycerophosphoryl diester phosphodiesterase
MLIFSHRGVAHDGADENSVKAFCHALEHGIDGIELDIRLTRDGVAVVTHDKDLRRIAGNNRKIESLLSKELREIPLRRGSSIPELDEVTAHVPPPMLFDIEIKDIEAFQAVAKKLRTSKTLRDRTIISSFHKGVIELAEKEIPDVRKFLLVRRWFMRPLKFQEWAKAVHLTGLGFPYTAWTQDRVAWTQDRTLLAVAWELFPIRSTVRRAARLVDLGLDVVIVNQPLVYVEARKRLVHA